MTEFDWQSLLEELNGELLGINDVRETVGLPVDNDLPEDVELVEWLGFEGASESDLTTLERRLGVALPPSYRSFLATSNGWRTTGGSGVRLLPSTGVEWLRDVDPSLIAIWKRYQDQWPPIPDADYLNYEGERYGVLFRSEFIPDMLVISDRGEFNVHYLWLNPRVVFDDGEWEAWGFTTDDGHASRYRSFRDLMADTLRFARVDRKYD